MNHQLFRSKLTFKYANMYQKAREEGDNLLAFYALFHLQVDDSCEEEGSDFQLYMDNKTTCGVCLAPIPKREGALTECFHLFCRVCLDQWLQENATCPMCRQHVCKYRLPIKSNSYKHKCCRDPGCSDGMFTLRIANFWTPLAVLRRGWRPPPKRFFSEPPSLMVLFRTPHFSQNKVQNCVKCIICKIPFNMYGWSPNEPIRRFISHIQLYLFFLQASKKQATIGCLHDCLSVCLSVCLFDWSIHSFINSFIAELIDSLTHSLISWFVSSWHKNRHICAYIGDQNKWHGKDKHGLHEVTTRVNRQRTREHRERTRVTRRPRKQLKYDPGKSDQSDSFTRPMQKYI